MEYSKHIQQAIDFIEEEIYSELTLQDIGERACYSPNHLHHIFTKTSGISVKEYIRRRRMNLAVKELKCGSKRIIDIALQSGYGSHESFTRAFQQYFGVSPRIMRKSNNPFHCYDPLFIDKTKLINQYNEELNIPRTYILPALKVAGLTITGKNNIFDFFPHVKNLWRKIKTDKTFDSIPNRINPGRFIGLSFNTWVNNELHYHYTAGVEVSDFSSLPKGVAGYTLSPAQYFSRSATAEPSSIEIEWNNLDDWLIFRKKTQVKKIGIEVYEEPWSLDIMLRDVHFVPIDDHRIRNILPLRKNDHLLKTDIYCCFDSCSLKREI